MNHEGYRDPTADRAVGNASRKQKNITPDHVMDVVNALRVTAHLMGYEVIGRIQLRDTMTGKEYR